MRRFNKAILFLTISICAICFSAFKTKVIASENGIASYYHKKFEGRRTSSGEIFKHSEYTAAHKSLPLGTYVRVTNLKNDSMVIVKINDRLPARSKRTIDLTKSAASKLNMLRSGLAKVKVEVLAEENNSSSEAK